MSQIELPPSLRRERPAGIKKYLRWAPYVTRFRYWFSKIDPFARRHALTRRADLTRLQRKFQGRFVKGQGLKPTEDFLDIGCGSLVGGVPIIRHLEPGRYTGLDVREQVLELARQEVARYGLEAKQPKLIHFEDLKDLNLDQKFDFIWNFAVLMHLTDEQVKDCFGFVARHLKDDGVYYANVTSWGFPNRKWFEFPIIDRPFETYREWADEAGLSGELIGELQDFGLKTYYLEEDGQSMLRFRLKK